MPKTVIFTDSMLNISCLKGDSDQTKFRFGISVKTALDAIFFEKIRGTSFFIYRKSENSERIRLIFELDRDIDVTMLCKKFEGCEVIISGVIVLTAGRPDILTDFSVYSLFEYTKMLARLDMYFLRKVCKINVFSEGNLFLFN